jgi:hypothetical protein
MSLARDWIEAALQADLSQNELRAFLVLFHQTLCYGKTHDALTLKRVAQLAHVRVDRITPALRAIADKGLIEIEAHAVFGQTFIIPPALLQHSPTGFVVPALPKNRKPPPQNSNSPPEKQVTITTKTLTAENPTTTADATAQALPYPPQFDAAQRQRARELLDGLSPNDAHDCLAILTQALREPHKVRSPLGFLCQLAKAARRGGLDRTCLRSPPTSTLPDNVPTQPPAHRQIQQILARQQAIQAEIQHVQQFYRLADTPLPAIEVQKFAGLRQEWQRLAANLTTLLAIQTHETRHLSPKLLL